MPGLVERLDKRFYPQFDRNWDDSLFRESILEHLRPDMTILDIGAGAGIVPQMAFRGMAAKVCGVDPDPRVVDNPYLDEGLEGVGESLPYPDETFDLVFADNVMEHLENPAEVFEEIARVLKPGGVFLGKTPNKWHYMPLIARLTPHGFHQWVNRRRGRAEVDTFPTRYRANTPGDVARHARRAGLELVKARLVEGRPEYLRFNPFAYVFGILYERLVNAVSLFAGFRILLMVTLRKPLAGD